MAKKFICLLLIIAMVVSLTACGGSSEKSAPSANDTAASSDTTGESGSQSASSQEPSGSVMLYSSLKESQLEALKEAFMKKYPNIKMDYYAAGTSKIATKLATEKQSGQIACDIVWVGDPSNYITFKEQGILEPYKSPEAENIDEKFKDPDNYYCGARLVVMGLAYNTVSVSEENVPKKWTDLLSDEFKDQIVITDPGESGTTFYLFAGMVNNDKYGIDFFKKLKENGAELESGTTTTHNKVAANAYKVCIAVDYVTQTLEKEGATIKFVYPEEDLIVVSSPIALIKGAKNLENAKLLYDFILSTEGQKLLSENDCTPIRKDVVKEGSLSLDEIIERAMPVDDKYIAEHSSDILAEFDNIFK